MSLQSAVEELFSGIYLFDRDHELWRNRVSPPDPEPGSTPPLVDLRILLSFLSVTSKCKSMKPEEQTQEIIDAVANSNVVVVEKPPGAPAKIRRADYLDDAQNPAKRTVFVKPVHFDAKEEEIRSFFAPYGEIEKIERRSFFDVGGGQKPRPSIFIVFKTVAAAQKCIVSKPSYGKLPNALGSHFIPSLTVTMKDSHEEMMGEEADREHAAQQRKAFIKASQPDAGSAAASSHHNFLTKGRTLKISGLRKAIPWQDIKTKLGNLTISFPELKGKLTHVRVEDDKSVAYCVTKTPKSATDFVVAYNTIDRSVIEDMKMVVPNLSLVEGAEEEYVIRSFPHWTTKQIDKKLTKNVKRPRDEQ